ncbi:MAG: ABC transporter substrate-binding protein [Thermodesulfobacteriota bacterium]
MNSWLRLIGLASLVFVFSLGFASWAVSQGTPKVKFGTAVRTSYRYMPLRVMLDKGLDVKHGVKVDWVPHKGGAALTTSFASGAIKIGNTSFFGVVRARLKGIPVKLIGTISPLTTGVAVTRDSPLRKKEDLKGKTLSFTRTGSMSHAFALWLAKDQGWQLGKGGDFNIISLGGYRTAAATLVAGKVDAATMPDALLISLLAKKRARPLFWWNDVLPITLIVESLVGTENYLAQNREVVARTLKAHFSGLDYMLDNPEYSIAKTMEWFNLPRAAAKQLYQQAIVKLMWRDGAISKSLVEGNIRWLMGQGLLKGRPVSFDELVHKGFVPIKP